MTRPDKASVGSGPEHEAVCLGYSGIVFGYQSAYPCFPRCIDDLVSVDRSLHYIIQILHILHWGRAALYAHLRFRRDITSISGWDVHTAVAVHPPASFLSHPHYPSPPVITLTPSTLIASFHSVGGLRRDAIRYPQPGSYPCAPRIDHISAHGLDKTPEVVHHQETHRWDDNRFVAWLVSKT